jgi:hypothetical protein
MSISVTCKNKYTDRSFTVSVPEDGTVHDIRLALVPLTKNRLDSLLLFEECEYLQHFVPLKEYGIGDGATLIYEARLCGPLPVNYDWSKSGLKTKHSRFTIQANKK